MIRKTLLVTILLILVTITLSFNTNAVNDKNTIYVDDDGGADYTSIQDAIDAANINDTIYVYNGIYHEEITITKPLRLIGENNKSTIIDGKEELRTIITIESDNVTISNFYILNSRGREWPDYDSGIKLNHSNNVLVSDNIIKNHRYCVYIDGSHRNIIENNVLENRLTEFGDYYGSGIYVRYSNNNSLKKNRVLNHFFGIILFDSNSSFIDGNMVTLTYSAISLRECACFHTVSNNILVDNNAGIKISPFSSLNPRADYNEIIGNTFDNNSGSGLYILSNYNIIRNNVFINDGFMGDFHQKEISNNTVNGLPMLYLKNESDLYITDGEFGQLIFIGCSNITVEGIHFLKTDKPIYFEGSYDCIVRNNSMLDQDYGIDIDNCNDFIIKNNMISNSEWSSIIIYYSNNITIQNNDCSNCYHGIGVHDSNYCDVLDNIVINNEDSGIILRSLYKSLITGNLIKQNGRSGLELDFSSNNIITENNFIEQEIHATFWGISKLIQFFFNKWSNNYWDDWSRNIPRPIFGKTGYYAEDQWITFDWNPAKEPFKL